MEAYAAILLFLMLKTLEVLSLNTKMYSTIPQKNV